MKNTGITRKIDDMGRIVLPMELRRNTGIDEGTSLEIYVDESGNIVLRPMAVPLTYIELQGRVGKPIYCQRSDDWGKWEILGRVCIDGRNAFMVTQDDKYYCFNDCSFYDKDV